MLAFVTVAAKNHKNYEQAYVDFENILRVFGTFKICLQKM